MTNIGSIQSVPLREVWPHEAHDFTRWLQHNLHELNRVTGLELISAEREQFTANFRVDLVAEDSSGRRAIIENQLERGNHDHLGKLLTYALNLDAKIAIWIVTHATEDHQRAVMRLNEEISTVDFYLIQLAAIRINDSPPAPIFTKLVSPTPEARQIGKYKREQNDTDQRRQQFWEALLARADQTKPPFANVSPTHAPWLGLHPSWPANLGCSLNLQGNRAYIKVAFPKTESQLSDILTKLETWKVEIETAIGHPILIHDGDDSRRSFRLDVLINDSLGLDSDVDVWPTLHQQFIVVATRLNEILPAYL